MVKQGSYILTKKSAPAFINYAVDDKFVPNI